MWTNFYNVGHGEAIHIALRHDVEIIRDFGRSRFAKNTEFSSSLKRLMACEENNIGMWHFKRGLFDTFDAVLSHAHEDHFNGFEMMYEDGIRGTFNNAYIPWLRMRELNSLGGLLIKYSLFLYRYYGSDNLIASNAKHWLRAAPIMAALSKKLWCVSAGHHVKHWGVKNKILWPGIKHVGYEQKLEDYWKRYLKNNELEENFLNEEVEEIRAILDSYYPENIEGQEGQEFNIDSIPEALSRIDSILSKPFSDGIKQKLSSPRALNTYAYKYTIDNHSLIFEIGDTDKESLFLSDADDKTMDIMFKYNGIQDKNYSLIKSSHHGNRGARALINNNITSDCVVNCCGPAHSNWKGPDINYLNVSKKLFCTDWNDHSIKWDKKTKRFYTIPDHCYIEMY